MRLILNDGTIIEDGRAGYSGGYLWCYFTGYTLQETATLFFDTEKTSTIVFEYGAERDIYEGLTRCVNLGIDVDGIISVCMTKETT